MTRHTSRSIGIFWKLNKGRYKVCGRDSTGSLLIKESDNFLAL